MNETNEPNPTPVPDETGKKIPMNLLNRPRIVLVSEHIKRELDGGGEMVDQFPFPSWSPEVLITVLKFPDGLFTQIAERL